MDSIKIEREADDDNCAESEMLSIRDTSSLDDNGRNRGGTEAKNRMKLRSLKLSSFPSLRSCVRPMKSPFSKCPSVFSCYATSSEQSTPVARSNSSPNNLKATSCSDERKESFQKSGGTFTRRSSFKPMKSLAKISSIKFGRPLMRKSSGGTDLKKLKKTRSIKPASSRSSRPSTGEEHVQSDQLEEHTSARNSKASPQNSDSSYGGNDPSKESLNIVRPMPDSSARAFKRKVTLRPRRILTKTASLKSRRSSMKTSSEDSEISDPSIVRATCSSTLKDTKFPQGVELQPGGSESEGISAIKVCTYSYCSLHGHRHGSHGNLPPLKQFVSMRRRSLKTQKSMKLESSSVPKVKRSRTRRKVAQTSQMNFNGDSADQETAQTRREKSSVIEKVFKVQFTGANSHAGEAMNIGDSANFSQILLGETSNPDPRPEPKDSKQCDNPSMKHDGVVSTSLEEAPVDATVHKELNGYTVEHLNLEGFKGKLNIEVSEARTATRVINEEMPEDSEPDNVFKDGFSQSGESTANCTADQSQKTHTGKKKYIRLWGLINRHMASGINPEDETELPRDGKEEAEQVKDGCTMPQTNNSVSGQSCPRTDEDLGVRDHNAGDQKFEIWKTDAIKLVQEAFDKILSEIPDQLSDDQSIISDTTSEQELIENNQCEVGQLNISSYSNRTEASTVQHPEETQMEAVNVNTSEEQKAASEVGSKSSQQISKSWSNLKKVIILKRFVKALEKVNKSNPRKLQILPIEANPETEKVHLRHQTVEERKNADEWMLDYALRQVISKLAPAQRRKVALLVQAFETVTPEISTHLRSNSTAPCQSTPLQVCTDCSIQRGGQIDSGFLHEPSYPEMSIEDTTEQVSNFPKAERHIPGTELQERSLGCCCSNTVVELSASEITQKNLKEEEEESVSFNVVNEQNYYILTDEQPGFSDVSSTNPEIEPNLSNKPFSKPDNSKSTSHDGKILLEVSKDVPLAYDSEFHDHDIKVNNKKLESDNLLNAAGEQSCQPKSLSPENFMESSAVSSVVPSTSFSELVEESPRAVCGEEVNTKYEFQKSSPLEESELNDTINMAQESKLEKQKYMRLWYLLYKHMVSGSTEAETQPIPEGAQKEEERSDDNAFIGTKDASSCQDLSQMNQKLIMDNQNASCQEIECDQIEAIKIIEEAIDEIPLPDSRDDSLDSPPIRGNMIPEQELQKRHSEDGELFISTSTDSSKDSFRESNNTKVENDKTPDPRETKLISNNIPVLRESEPFSKSANKSNPRVQKNWSNLKKVILLKRFIKSLEKVRKFNPREPRYPPLEPNKRAENVHLRHQTMEDRKKAKEWMLDHALQQVVAKLTPARKRKVELLVEAFETVTPHSYAGS